MTTCLARPAARNNLPGNSEVFGQLTPVTGGDPIPLLKKRLRIGRREGCDIVLNFPNVSAHHAVIEIEEGYWFIRDLNSRNGVKVDGRRILQGLKKRLDPNSIVSIAKHQYTIEYDPSELGAYGTPPQDEQLDKLFSQPLLDRAGLRRRNNPDLE
jgi:adenylate cyclase